MIFWRAVRGEESVGTAFFVSLIPLAIYYAYDYFVPSFSDFFTNWFRYLHLILILMIIAAVHNSCGATGFALRLAARTYVVGMLAFGIYLSYEYFNLWVVGGFFIAAFIVPYLFRE